MTKHPSPALIISLIALFVALGGTTLAAGGLISGSKLKNRSVAAVKLKKHTLTGNEINLGQLGTVPSAALANRASHASSADNATHASSADSATHASSADSATHASSADSATHASSADSATSFGGLTPSQYIHADTFSGFQSAAKFNGTLTIATLSTPSIAAGAYLLIARVEPDQTGVSPSLAMNCNLTGPSGAGLDSARAGVIQNEGAEFPLVGTDTSATAGAAVVSCNVSGSHPFSLFVQLSVIRLGSETHTGALG
jgi:hypothetical protein